jgi:isoquinoline 1-oxidoreductase alpha subunit
MIAITVNGEARLVDVAPDTPLLWMLREQLALTGTKFGCGMALCGACTVHRDGVPIRSCVTPVSAVADGAITTIEGVRDVSAARVVAEAVLRAWHDAGVPQCGYCQPGMVMATVALLTANRAPDDEAIDRALAGHLCRCGSYQRLRAAVHLAAGALVAGSAVTGAAGTSTLAAG